MYYLAGPLAIVLFVASLSLVRVFGGGQCVRICSIPQLKSFKMRTQFSSQMAGHPGRGYEYFITRPGWVGTPCLPGTPRRDFVSALFACRALPGTLCMCVCVSGTVSCRKMSPMAWQNREWCALGTRHQKQSPAKAFADVQKIK